MSPAEVTLREFMESSFDALRRELRDSHRELREGQDRIENESIDRLEQIDKKVDRIEGQTTRTNGRVDGLEAERDRREGRWEVVRVTAKWAFAVIGVVIGAAILAALGIK